MHALLLTVASFVPMMMYEAWKIPQFMAAVFHFAVSTTATMPSQDCLSPPFKVHVVRMESDFSDVVMSHIDEPA
ncbi:hypothetical protein N7540_003559 [Penicillium herquei]|nr:hypothetical protein N7540_003559 [Penicillium herquei]